MVPLLPPDLVVTRFVSLRAVTPELAKQNPLQVHVRIKEWGEDGEVRGRQAGLTLPCAAVHIGGGLCEQHASKCLDDHLPAAMP